MIIMILVVWLLLVCFCGMYLLFDDLVVYCYLAVVGFDLVCLDWILGLWYLFFLCGGVLFVLVDFEVLILCAWFMVYVASLVLGCLLIDRGLIVLMYLCLISFWLEFMIFGDCYLLCLFVLFVVDFLIVWFDVFVRYDCLLVRCGFYGRLIWFGFYLLFLMIVWWFVWCLLSLRLVWVFWLVGGSGVLFGFFGFVGGFCFGCLGCCRWIWWFD